jgi:UDP-3-O-[3-hydroxymyristoyl] glucosamine N-acyltransferase
MRVRELAALLDADFAGDGGLEITACAPIESATESEISFAANRKAIQAAEASRAGCLIVPAGIEIAERTLLFTADPRAAFAKVLAVLHPPRNLDTGVHPTAVIHPSAEIADSAVIGPFCVVGAESRIGEETRLHAHVSIYDRVSVGRRCILHSGCVLGADGFGFALTGGRYEKFPQVGRVEIGDDVEIGANATVDRAALGVTRIGAGTKLDNMVHVGHNVTIGEHVVIAAQTGISGGAVIGDYAVIAGQVGLADKVRIEPKAVLGAQCGVPSNKIIRAGEPVWGTPARPIKEYLEQLAHLKYLGDLRREVAELKQRLAEKP